MTPNPGDAISSPALSSTPRPLLLVVEGNYDLEFLTRLSRRLHAEGAHSLDLNEAIRQGYIVPIPIGGGSIDGWQDRLAALRCREFHLYDREIAHETHLRQAAIAAVNRRPGCVGFLTGRRSLENYLHPQAVTAAGGGQIRYGANDCVGTVLARHWYELIPQDAAWTQLSRRRRSRWIHRAKRWLNTQAVEQMTAALLAEHDPAKEVLGWFDALAKLIGMP